MSAQKVALRALIRAQRDRLAAGTRRAWGERITAGVLALPEVTHARCVLAYLSFGSEFDTSALLSALVARGVRIALPKVDRGAQRLRLFHVRAIAQDTAAGIWGIREPREDRCDEARKEQIDLVIVPGVAFTAGGDRLGYGGGFYDRLLGDWPARPPLVAPAFAMQIVDALPVDAHDVAVDLVVTESQVHRRR